MGGFFGATLERITPTPDSVDAKGFGAPLHIAFEYRPLPGAGAMQYAYETLALPMYTPIGWGVANRDSFDAVGSPVVAWSQTLGIESLFYNGDPSGQITTQPLVNTDSNGAGNGLEAVAFGPSANYALPDR